MTQSSDIVSSLPVPLPQDTRWEPSPVPTDGRLGFSLGLLVFLLAFLLASFPAQNSDLWLHLAQGRLLMQGQSPSAVAPDLAAELRDNQTWLYDILCYGTYSVLGGVGLVVGKALLAAGIALLLLWQSRTTSGWSVPVACTLLALLAMSLRLLLQPATLSYLLLALALAYLQWMRQSEHERPAAPLRLWPLFLIFFAWVNADRWFVLGLVVVALLWIGEVMDASLSSDEAQDRGNEVRTRRGLALLLLCLACLLNPAHVRAFALPADLSWIAGPASTVTEHASADVTTPFQKAYFTNFGLSPAALAYFPLLAFSALSFVANRSHWSWRRFLPWLVLALLSIVQVRTVPFFALVAGPVMAWNFQESLSRFFAQRRRQERMASRWGGVLCVFAAIVLLVCAWPGWLQRPPFEPRRWSVDFSPSLERGAETLRRWRDDGIFGGDAAAMHVSNESYRAFTWFCPDVRGKRFDRLEADSDGRHYLRAEGIHHVVVYGFDAKTILPILMLFLSDPDQWPLLYREGDLAVFGWRDPDVNGSAHWFRTGQVDLSRPAFAPEQTRKAPRKTDNVPLHAREWWEAFWKPATFRSLDRDEARMDLLFANAHLSLSPMQNFLQWEGSQLAGLIAASRGWSNPSCLIDASLRLAMIQPPSQKTAAAPERTSPLEQMALFMQNHYASQRDAVPIELFYRAIRSARCALADNPHDALTHLALGESYLGLLHNTRERIWSSRFHDLVQLRQAQASTALNQAILLRPDLPLAHRKLSQLYRQMGYFDLALKHLRTYAQLSRQRGTTEQADTEESKSQRKRLQEELERLTKNVETRDDEFTLLSEKATIRDRALLAAQKGLARKALEMLLESHVSAFGNEGLRLEMELMLNTGRAREVRDWLTPEHLEPLGAAQYHSLLVRAMAATGDYERAEEEVVELRHSISAPLANEERIGLRNVMAMLVCQLLFSEGKTGDSLPAVILREYSRTAFVQRIQTLSDVLRQQGDKQVLRGLLLWEEGELDDASFAFDFALSVWKNDTMAASGGGLDFSARPIAQAYLELLRVQEKIPLRKEHLSD